MKSKKSVLIIIIALVVLLVAAGVIYAALSKKEAENRLAEQETAQQSVDEKSGGSELDEPQTVAEYAPDFSVTDSDGNTVALSDFIGKPVVLNFWASWCGPCQNEMPDFNEAAAELGEEVQFMMVNLTDGRLEKMESATRFIEQNGYTFPVFFDTLSEGAEAYSVRSIPATYFIDAEGRLITYASGNIDGVTLRDGIAMITK